MRVLRPDEANTCLRTVGMFLGEWNQIAHINSGEIRWIRFIPPTESRALLSFSRHVVTWLPTDRWKIFQIDNSTSFDSNEGSLIEQLLVGAAGRLDVEQNRTFMFDFDGSNRASNAATDLRLANLIYAFLFVEAHAYVASSASSVGQLLALQDGAVHFGSLHNDDAGAGMLLRRFELEPLSLPGWTMDLEAVRQR